MSHRTYSDGSLPTICVIGAGFSGLLAGFKLKTQLGLKDVVIFEQNKDVGGVWLVNTYPGCGCDVPSHLYSYSFEMNPYWSSNYVSQQEILEYLRNFTQKYKLYQNIKFNSEVRQLVWDEKISQWRVSVYDKKRKTTMEYIFNIVINSPGGLRVPKIPTEFQSFKKPMFHSAAWDASIDLKGKVVGVIGSGASAVQIITSLASAEVKELHCYQRNPPWVMPRMNFAFPLIVKWIFAYIPFSLRLYRWILFWMMEIFYPALVRGTCLRRIAKWHASRHLKTQISGNETLRKKLEPKSALGCYRTIVSSEYFPAMQKPCVKLHVDPIISVHSDGIETGEDGFQNLDVLILATGFHVQKYFAPMSIIGVNGLDLLDAWLKYRPTGYLGIVTSSTPNQFGVLGPHTGLGHNSVVFMAECQVNYIVQLIAEMIRLDARVVELKKSTEEEEMELLDEQMKKTVWGTESCGSWYENASGINTTLWPWSCVKYWKRTRKPDFTKFNFLENLEEVVAIQYPTENNNIHNV